MPQIKASKPLKPFQGLKRHLIIAVASQMMVASKPLKPFQGLKQLADNAGWYLRCSFKASKTLSGIET